MGHISEFHVMFTDARPPEALGKLLEQHNVRLVMTE
jgi:DeoR family glycerol-3-phosphate regulon repressor